MGASLVKITRDNVGEILYNKLPYTTPLRVSKVSEVLVDPVVKAPIEREFRLLRASAIVNEAFIARRGDKNHRRPMFVVRRSSSH